MGVSTSMAEVAAKVDRLQGQFDGRALAAITHRVGARAVPIAANAVDPKSLSHWGRGRSRGGKVGAKLRDQAGSEVAIVPTVPPLAALLELGSYKAGGTWKAPRRRGAARRKRGSVGTYQRANVPARGAWRKTYGPVERAVPRFVDEEVQRAIRGVF
jgi:hypothetical protein